VTNPQASIVVASDSVIAWNGDFAAPHIAQGDTGQIESVRRGQRTLNHPRLWQHATFCEELI